MVKSPWRINGLQRKGFGGSRFPYIEIDTGGSGVDGGVSIHVKGNGIGQCCWNARKICAAPQMLAALREVRTRIDQFNRRWNWPDGVPEHIVEETMQMVEEAIAAAEDGDPENEAATLP